MNVSHLKVCRLFSRTLILATALLALAAGGRAQTVATADLPDAPQAPSQTQTPQPAGQTTPTPQQPTAGSQQTSSSSQDTSNAQTKEQQSEDELKKEEKQRILGVVPNFNTTNNQNALPLTPKQKLHLFFRSSVDPFVFAAAGLDAAVEQADNSFPEYGQGMEGYGKRIGASYADTFDGNLWGNAILPSLLHEDPRYFRKGTGTFWHRAFYSAATNVWSRRDNGTWGPNYANVGGNFIAGGISNLYYPASDRGFGLTAERAVTVTAEGAIGSEFVEFWPDISNHWFHKKSAVPAAQPSAPDATKPVDQTKGQATPPTNPPNPQ